MQQKVLHYMAPEPSLTDMPCRIWRMFYPMDSVAYYYSLKKVTYCSTYRTSSPIYHPSKVMLKVILNRHKLKARELIAENRRSPENQTGNHFVPSVKLMENKEAESQCNIFLAKSVYWIRGRLLRLKRYLCPMVNGIYVIVLHLTVP